MKSRGSSPFANEPVVDSPLPRGDHRGELLLHAAVVPISAKDRPDEEHRSVVTLVFGLTAWQAAAVLALCAAAVFVPVLRAGFVWGDAQTITHNPLIRSMGGFGHVWATPVARATPYYAPITATFL